jgi:hypothetical protein
LIWADGEAVDILGSGRAKSCEFLCLLRFASAEVNLGRVRREKSCPPAFSLSCVPRRDVLSLPPGLSVFPLQGSSQELDRPGWMEADTVSHGGGEMTREGEVPMTEYNL